MGDRKATYIGEASFFGSGRENFQVELRDDSLVLDTESQDPYTVDIPDALEVEMIDDYGQFIGLEVSYSNTELMGIYGRNKGETRKEALEFWQEIREGMDERSKPTTQRKGNASEFMR